MIRCAVRGIWPGNLSAVAVWVVAPSIAHLQTVLAPWPTLSVFLVHAQNNLPCSADDFVLPAGTMALVAYLIRKIGEPPCVTP